MGYLNSQIITVDAILTTKGRQLLSQGNFNITQFALSDDEIDYTLYNPNHPSGSSYYGEAIENMPLLEAFPDETQIMKYKLITLPRGTAKIPILDAGTNNIILKQGASFTIIPQTLNYLGGNSKEQNGYTATIYNVNLMNTFLGVGINTPNAQALNSTTTIGTNVSKTVIGTSISLTATTLNTIFSAGSTQAQTTILIEGRDSGARLTIPVTITKI